VVRKVRDDSVESIRDRGARGASGGVVRAEHEVIDEQLRSALEEIRERYRPVVAFECIVLVDANPGKLLSASGQLVAAPRQLFLIGEEFEAGREPVFARSDRMCFRHCALLLHGGRRRPRDLN
jgi:hypothetical protein